MRPCRSLIAAVWLVSIASPGVVAAAHASQAATQQTVDVETLGPKVGERVPDFSLPDQNGQTRSLASLLGPKGAVLVFFRSADW